MNKRLLTLVTVVFTGLLFFTAGALIAADVAEEVTIDSKGYKKDKKPPLKFSHKKHNVDYKIACTDCHHEYKDGKNVWKDCDPVKKCVECHNPLKKEGKTLKLQNAFHRNCKNCHKEVNAKDASKKAPFKKCTQCHKK